MLRALTIVPRGGTDATRPRGTVTVNSSLPEASGPMRVPLPLDRTRHLVLPNPEECEAGTPIGRGS
jgi:hypothetical protein